MALVMTGCGRKKQAHVPQTPAPMRTHAARPVPAVPLGYTEEGIASWYGIPYHGRRAADGEIYDMETLVAAHRTLPFNTWIRVTNLSNGKDVVLRVIDRGPFVDGRIIDLSKAAARQIDLLGPGIGRVRLQVIAAPADVPSNDFFAVQIGAFSVEQNAERARDIYAQRFGAAQIAVKQGNVTLWRVLVGKEPTFAAAQQLASTLAATDPHVFVVRLDQAEQPAAAVVSATPAIPVVTGSESTPSD
jgi:rare lipoprotein A